MLDIYIYIYTPSEHTDISHPAIKKAQTLNLIENSIPNCPQALNVQYLIVWSQEGDILHLVILVAGGHDIS